MLTMPSSFLLTGIDRQMQADIRTEQMRMFISNTPSVCIYGSFFATVLAIYLAQYASGVLVYSWLALKILIIFPRIANAYFLSKNDSYDKQLNQRIALILLFFDGLCWGLVGPMLIPEIDDFNSTILGCSLMSIVSVATFTLHVFSIAPLIFCAPILIPSIIAHFFLNEGSFGFFMGISQLLFLVAIISVSKKARINSTEMLWRRFSMDRILNEKEESLAEAQRQDTIKSQFVATMSHEFRTPLHGILGLTSILHERSKDAGIRDNLRTIELAGKHLLSLINSVLDFSKIQAGGISLDNNHFDLYELMAETFRLTLTSAQQKGLTLTMDSGLPSPTWVEGDSSKFKQVFLNLVGNAVKFTDAGEISISSTYDPSTGLVTIKVKDSGIGIQAKDVVNIFEPYKQVQNPSGRSIGGTGLGLTISKEISRMMGGDIACESDYGKGSTFTFTAVLPSKVIDSNQEASHMSLNISEKPQAVVSDMVQLKGHVLVAEDNELNALILELQLKRKGLTVEIFKNGQDVLNRLVNGVVSRPDIVLMDCQMPLLDGFEVTKRLRQHEVDSGLPHLPVVALTASAMAEDSKRCLNAGMNAHLSKPYSEVELFNMLHVYLQPHVSSA